MKKFLLTASAIAIIAVGCTDKNGTNNKASEATGIESSAAASATVVYFNLDSLLSKYDMYVELRASYEQKAQKAEAELTSKGRSLERDVTDFQTKVEKGLITRAQAENLQMQLQTKQQSFMQYRDRILAEMGEEEQVMLNKIHYAITEFIKDYNKDYRYGMIISSTSTGGPVINADPKLDITKDIVEGLNKKYAEEQKTTKPAPASTNDKK